MYEIVREVEPYVLALITIGYLCDIAARTIVIESVKRRANRGNLPQSLIGSIIHPIRSEDETILLEREISEDENYYIPSF